MPSKQNYCWCLFSNIWPFDVTASKPVFISNGGFPCITEYGLGGCIITHFVKNFEKCCKHTLFGGYAPIITKLHSGIKKIITILHGGLGWVVSWDPKYKLRNIWTAPCTPILLTKKVKIQMCNLTSSRLLRDPAKGPVAYGSTANAVGISHHPHSTCRNLHTDKIITYR